jgi:hypothetical protein
MLFWFIVFVESFLIAKLNNNTEPNKDFSHPLATLKPSSSVEHGI